MMTGGDASSSGISSAAGGRISRSSGSTNGGGLFDPETLPTKIAELRQDLLSLITLDNELFKNLLTINDTIEELREQRVTADNLQGNLKHMIYCALFIFYREMKLSLQLF